VPPVGASVDGVAVSGQVLSVRERAYVMSDVGEPNGVVSNYLLRAKERIGTQRR
jgi:hypothetical protein